MDRVDAFWHEDVLLHDTGAGVFDAEPQDWLEVPETHAENAERVRNMRGILRAGPLADRVAWHDGRHATVEEITALHDADYVAEVEAACARGHVFTRTTLVAPGSWEAIRAAAGTALNAADAVLDGRSALAYALVRPPGHHASQRTADGYCFVNNTALAAERARRSGLDRVAIVDWDVHHGNGTQTLFYERDDVLTISFHMRHRSWNASSHPESGAPDEVGRGAGEGLNVNIELPLGTGNGGYLNAWDRIVAPVVASFAPDLVIIASGQDANQYDPNARQAVDMDGFRGLGERARALADRHGERLLMVQEGGYSRTYSAMCLHASLEGVLGTGKLLDDPVAFLPDQPERAEEAIEAVRAAHAPYWTVLR